MSAVVRVVIVDDHPMFRKGLRLLLESLPDFELVGEACDGPSALALARQFQPDVMLMDLQMPGLNGVEATRQILRESPHIGILVLTMYDDDELVFAAMRAGARGYLLKGADQDEILTAIHTVSLGGAIFGPAIANRLIAFFASPKPALPADLFPELTDREAEILDLVAQGMSNPEIADKLVLSGKTVRNHVSNVFSKLQVADRAHAIVKAREAGMGHQSSTGPLGLDRL